MPRIPSPFFTGLSHRQVVGPPKHEVEVQSVIELVDRLAFTYPISKRIKTTRDFIAGVLSNVYNKGYAQAIQDAQDRQEARETECAWSKCNNDPRAGSKYCSRQCSNKSARFRAAERRQETS